MRQTNPFEHRMSSTAGIARDIVPITPSDTENLESIPASLYIETGGTIVFLPEKHNAPLRTLNVPDNFTLNVGVRRVHAAGTTASGIHGYMV